MMHALIRAMEAYGTTQQLADDSKVPIQTIKRLKAGETDAPSVPTLVALARTMEISLDEMFGLGNAQHQAAEAHKNTPHLPCHTHGSCGIVRQVSEMYEDQILYCKRIVRALGCACAILVVIMVVGYCF